MNDHDLADQFRDIIASSGDDPDREGLAKTPERAAEAFDFLTHGYQEDLWSIVNGALFESDIDEMVIVRDIEFYSLCEHHVLPFFGRAQVAYVPNGQVLGLSKIARIIDMYARRLQIQETLTKQIAEAIQTVTQAKGVAVQVNASHMCMMMRGVCKQNSEMSTSVMLGVFRECSATRHEFLQLIARP